MIAPHILLEMVLKLTTPLTALGLATRHCLRVRRAHWSFKLTATVLRSSGGTWWSFLVLNNDRHAPFHILDATSTDPLHVSVSLLPGGGQICRTQTHFHMVSVRVQRDAHSPGSLPNLKNALLLKFRRTTSLSWLVLFVGMPRWLQIPVRPCVHSFVIYFLFLYSSSVASVAGQLVRCMKPSRPFVHGSWKSLDSRWVHRHAMILPSNFDHLGHVCGTNLGSFGELAQTEQMGISQGRLANCSMTFGFIYVSAMLGIYRIVSLTARFRSSLFWTITVLSVCSASSLIFRAFPNL